MPKQWKTNTPISMPAPLDPKIPPLVNFGGFCFTAHGLKHNITQADLEDYTLFDPEWKVEDDSD